MELSKKKNPSHVSPLMSTISKRSKSYGHLEAQAVSFMIFFFPLWAINQKWKYIDVVTALQPYQLKVLPSTMHIAKYEPLL